METVPEILYRLRCEHGYLPVGMAARRAGVHSSQWSRWENGMAPIPLRRAALIADSFRCPELLRAANKNVRNVMEREVA